MCGIAGYVGVAGDADLLQRMNDTMIHRGPDGEGIFTDAHCGLAHRRLAIIDREHAAQPMSSADGRYEIVYNGEVYNYRELRAELADLGVAFTTHSDTEVVLAAYIAWGTAAFDRFNGMFGLAIYDTQTSELVLARDHFGIKPLYFAQPELAQAHGGRGGTVTVFGSEFAAILASGFVPKAVNERILYRYLKFRAHDDNPETFFAGISRLMPGEAMRVKADGTSERFFFTTLEQDLEAMATGPGEPYSAASAQEYRDRLTEAVRMRLVAEVPVGTALSGGLDSSTTVMLIDELLSEHAADTESIGKRQQTFSAVFKGESNDEERYVDAVLEDCEQRIDGHKIRPVADEFTDDLAEFVRVMEEPIISTGPYAQYRVMKYATDHVTVLLDGQGADETMAGYPPYYFVYLRQLKARKQYKELAREIRTSRDILWRFATRTKRDTLVRKKKVPVVSLLQPDFADQFTDETFPVIQDNLKLRLIQDIFYVSLPTLLRYEDKNTMKFSLEGRVPFLDKEVLKYQFALADDSIIHDGWNKRILRDATENLLPEMINKRRNKIGFTTPEDAWFDRLKSDIYTIFASEEFAARPYFNADAVLAAYQEFIAGRNDTGSMLFWRFLNVELWLREFFDPPKTEDVVVETKSDLVANENKELDLATPAGTVRRFPLQTGAVQEDTDIDRFVLERVADFMHTIADNPAAQAEVSQRPWYLFISEKIIAISQGRSWLLTDIKPTWWARTLSKGVSKTPYGIGLGAPETMQLAIEEAGLPRILWASTAGLAGKAVGKRGVFYNQAGSDVRAIDGPTAHSAYPSNVSAKLAPKDPQAVSRRISHALRQQLPDAWQAHFGGTVVIDANDLGRNILGDDTGLPEATLESYFADNPLGQGKEMTPLSVVVSLP